MSEMGFDFGPEQPEQPREPGSRRAEKESRGRGGCLALVLVGALILVGLFFGGGAVLDKVKSMVGGSADYSGSGSGSVTIEVHSGDSSAAIGRTLKSAGVVKSVDAFIDAATNDSRSRSIGAGFYKLNKGMKASLALTSLVTSKPVSAPSCAKTEPPCSITIPEGFRVKQIAARLVAEAHLSRAKVNPAVNDPAGLGLPPEANGKLEGYLFPATYTVTTDSTAKSLLSAMVSATKQTEKRLGIAAKAQALGYSVSQIMTVASILEYEAGRTQDYPKVARAIYNRLDAGMALQSDATVAYANNLSKTLYTSDADRAKESPYNTYLHTGLPPGPIGSPGETTIKAALNPTPGPWLYWVVVNLRTKETRFNTTYAGHQHDVALFHQYCRTSDAC